MAMAASEPLRDIAKQSIPARVLRTLILLISAAASTASAQESVTILEIDAGKRTGGMYPMWAYFGYDEPNYTYMHNGQKLLTELSALSPVPVYVRAHNLLNTDEGPRAALKWGSTNVYTEDEDGNAVYDWTLIDRIMDTYVERGMKPLVEIGFMPKALSSKPEPYRHHWSPGDAYGDIYTGWAQPPNSYEKWAELVYRWVRHSVERYGAGEVETWWWEVWNEPNIGYWQGTQEEYFKLYDYAADAVKRALPRARIGGPTTTGPRWDPAADWLRAFLEHCRSGTNHVTGKTGSPLDFISYHAKGAPEEVDGHVRMDMGAQLADVAIGFEIVADSGFPELPVIIGEADPEGCAACSFASGYRGNGYRNGVMYASYTASSFAKMYELADEYGINFEGALSWSFQFENQPWFDGFRALATNGVNKPVLNVFRMFGMMQGERIAVSVRDPVTARDVIEGGVRGQRPDVNALASRSDRGLQVMVWNYHDDDVAASGAPLEIRLTGIPVGKALLHHYRIDDLHSNSYTVWRELGAPQQVTRAQYAALERAGQLELLRSPEWLETTDSGTMVSFELPRQGISFLALSW
jgi:xylan 1,4-beta-xylosidase